MRIEIKYELFEDIFQDSKKVELQLDLINGWLKNIEDHPQDSFFFVPADKWVTLLAAREKSNTASANYKNACQKLLEKITPLSSTQRMITPMNLVGMSGDLFRMVLANFTAKELLEYVLKQKTQWELALQVMFGKFNDPEVYAQRTRLMISWLKHLANNKSIDPVTFLNRLLPNAEGVLTACMEDAGGDLRYRLCCNLLIKKLQGSSSLRAEVDEVFNHVLTNFHLDLHDLIDVYLHEFSQEQVNQLVVRFASSQLPNPNYHSANILALAPRCDSKYAAEIVTKLTQKLTYKTSGTEFALGPLSVLEARDISKAYAARCTEQDLRTICAPLLDSLNSKDREEVKAARDSLVRLAQIGKLPGINELIKKLLKQLNSPFTIDRNARIPDYLVPNERLYGGSFKPDSELVALISRAQDWEFAVDLMLSLAPPGYKLDASEFNSAKQFIKLYVAQYKSTPNDKFSVKLMRLFDLCDPRQKKELQAIISQKGKKDDYADLFPYFDDAKKKDVVKGYLKQIPTVKKKVYVDNIFGDALMPLLKVARGYPLTPLQVKQITDFIGFFTPQEESHESYNLSKFHSWKLPAAIAALPAELGKQLAPKVVDKYLEWFRHEARDQNKDMQPLARMLTEAIGMMAEHLAKEKCVEVLDFMITELKPRLAVPDRHYSDNYLHFMRLVNFCTNAQAKILTDDILTLLPRITSEELGKHIILLSKLAPKLNLADRKIVVDALIPLVMENYSSQQPGANFALSALMPLLTSGDRQTVMSQLRSDDPRTWSVRLVEKTLPARGGRSGFTLT